MIDLQKEIKFRKIIKTIGFSSYLLDRPLVYLWATTAKILEYLEIVLLSPPEKKKKKKRKENLECLENTRKVCKPRGATKRG